MLEEIREFIKKKYGLNNKTIDEDELENFSGGELAELIAEYLETLK